MGLGTKIHLLSLFQPGIRLSGVLASHRAEAGSPQGPNILNLEAGRQDFLVILHQLFHLQTPSQSSQGESTKQTKAKCPSGFGELILPLQ